jgi:hypothetical protein
MLQINQKLVGQVIVYLCVKSFEDLTKNLGIPLHR